MLLLGRRAGEAVSILRKAVAIDPSNPATYEETGPGARVSTPSRTIRAASSIAAMRVDPGWTDWRRYLAALADFSERRFSEAADQLARIDTSADDPWPKFYGLQLLAATYGQLGDTAKARKAVAAFQRVLDADGGGPFTQLVTQQYFVFSHAADAERLLDGLTKAGVPDLPPGTPYDIKDRLSGAEITGELFGHAQKGQQTEPAVEPFERSIAADGDTTETIGTRQAVGRSWTQGNFLCAAFPRSVTNCGLILRDQPSAGGASYRENPTFQPLRVFDGRLSRRSGTTPRDFVRQCLSRRPM